jgi:hypothetical protein
MKIDLRKHLPRLVLTALAAVLGSGVVLGIVQANVQEWAKASGNDQYLVKYSGPTMVRLAEITSSGPFVFFTAMLIGGALSLWADTFVRRWLEWRASNTGKISFRTVDRKLASMTTLFIFITATVICGAWVLYEQRYGSSKQTDHVPQIANDQKPKAPLSEEDRRFRYELRGFSLSTLNDVLNASGRTFAMLRSIDRQRNEGTAELGARDYFIHFSTSTMDFGFAKIREALNSTNADEIDSDQVQELIFRYFQDYSQFQKFIAQLNAVLLVDLPKTEEMQRWLDADKQCRNELQKLKAWPQAKKLREIQDAMFASVDRTWERPPIAVTKNVDNILAIQKESDRLRLDLDEARKDKAQLEIKNQELQAIALEIQQRKVKSPLEELTASNSRLSSGDRERLSNALFEFSQVLDQANGTFGAMNSAGANLNNAWQDGSVAADSESHKARLLTAQTHAKEFESSFSAEREKWKYYQSNIAYIFGADPDNSALLARNGIDDYLNFLDRWTKIENKNEKPVLQLMWHAQLRFDGFLYGFSHWKNESAARLDQVKKSLQ